MINHLASYYYYTTHTHTLILTCTQKGLDLKSLGREKAEEARKVWGERAEQEGLGKQLMLLEVELI